MKLFSQLGIELKNQIFDCDMINIDKVIDKEILVINFIPDIKTRYGDNRYLLYIKDQDKEHKFFTNSKYLKQALDQISKSDFPFLTTIRKKNNGNKTIYMFS